MSLEKVSYQKLCEEIEKVEDEIGALTSLSTTDKSSIVAAVNETFQSVSNGKALVASAVTDKGVTTSSDATFSQMATNIAAIQTGITPSGTINISANGTYDVTDKANAVVSVGSNPTLVTKSITANGTYSASSDNADGYSSVSVAVPTGSMNSKVFKFTLSADVSGQQYVVNSSGDADIAAHRNDSSFVVGIMALTGTTQNSLRCVLVSNNSLQAAASSPAYGVYLRSGTSGVAGVYAPATANSAAASSVGNMTVDSSGVIRVFASSTYKLLAGDYIAFCAW